MLRSLPAPGKSGEFALKFRFVSFLPIKSRSPQVRSPQTQGPIIVLEPLDRLLAAVSIES